MVTATSVNTVPLPVQRVQDQAGKEVAVSSYLFFAFFLTGAFFLGWAGSFGLPFESTG